MVDSGTDGSRLTFHDRFPHFYNRPRTELEIQDIALTILRGYLIIMESDNNIDNANDFICNETHSQ